ncbi:MAG: PQQ-binding-like beta-propeller repeat protein [Paracoccaceae bacterium]
MHHPIGHLLRGALLSSVIIAPGALIGADWPSAAYDIRNNRFVADESTISPDNVGQLAPVNVITTMGNTWATAVGGDGRMFFPDAAGGIWAVDTETADVIWSAKVQDFTGNERGNIRSSAVYTDGMVIMGDRNGANILALDAESGDLLWQTDIDDHPNALVTGSPVAHDGRVYFGVSSLGAYEDVDGKLQSNFRGSVVGLDLSNGQEVWRFYTIPENNGALDSWSGGAVISSVAIDEERGTIYLHGDHYYSQPDDVIACMHAAPNDWDASCYPDDALANALVAADIDTGEVKWSYTASGAEAYEIACGEIPNIAYQIPVGHDRMCPPLGDWVNWGFAVGSPNLFTAEIDGETRDLVGVAQKSGFYWVFDADSGEIVWVKWVGPYSEPGGLAQGAAFDGERLYISVANFEFTPHFIGKAGCIGGICGDDAAPEAGATPIWGGSWAALDPATGDLIWQTAEPANARVYGSPVVANGVVFAGSMAAEGDQMFALDAETGEILWRFAAGGSAKANPAVVDGRVYWGSGFTLFGGVPNDQFYVFGLNGE